MAKRELRIDLVRFNSRPLINSPFRDVTNTQSLQPPETYSSSRPRSTINNRPDDDLFEKVFHLKPLKTYRSSLQSPMSMENVSFRDQRIEDWLKEQAVQAVARVEDSENSNVETEGIDNLKQSQNINSAKKIRKSKFSPLNKEADKFSKKLHEPSWKNKDLNNQNGAKSTKRTRRK